MEQYPIFNKRGAESISIGPELLMPSLLGAVILLEPACCEIGKVHKIDLAIVINITSELLKSLLILGVLAGICIHRDLHGVGSGKFAVTGFKLQCIRAKLFYRNRGI